MAAASLAYLTLHQQDSVGLVTYDNQVRQFLRPSSQTSHMKQVVNLLNKGAGKERTSLAPIFHDLAERIGRRSILIVFSDLFDDLKDILDGMKHLRHKRHEVIVMHVMDPFELEFPFQDATLFRGLEEYPELLTDPRSLRDGYLEEVNTFLREVEVGCRSQNVDYKQLRTDGNLGIALSSYLGYRLTRGQRG